jgi:hypothetical protein
MRIKRSEGMEVWELFVSQRARWLRCGDLPTQRTP